MSQASVINSRLTGNAAVAALIGTRCARGRARQGWFAAGPYVVWQQIKGGSQHDLSGNDLTMNPQVQFDCVAADSETADTLSHAVHAALEQWESMSTDPKITSSTHVDDRAEYLPPIDASEDGAMVSTLVFSFWTEK